VLKHKHLSLASDVYSFAMVLWEMAVGPPPRAAHIIPPTSSSTF